MLYKFKSKITGDLIMLEPNGRQVLQLIGKGDAASLTKGILLPADMPSAISALEHAIAEEEAAHKERLQDAQAAGEKTTRAETVSLRQRAVPFIDMVKRCQAANEEILWGV